MNWREAVIKVLQDSREPMHYTDIAQEIASSKLRKKNELGATPANSVSVAINSSLNKDGKQSPFRRVSKGTYSLSSFEGKDSSIVAPESESILAAGIINALGMFWEKDKVLWKSEPRILGKQQQDSKVVDFSGQVGIYLLHDTQGVIYVGRVTDQTLGRRLQQHTADRLNGRWTRFSWFGIYPAEDNGSLRKNVDVSNVGLEVVIATLEAVLIEGLEPRQNRRRGEDFKAVEFLQAEDPEIENLRSRDVLSQLASQYGLKITK